MMKRVAIWTAPFVLLALALAVPPAPIAAPVYNILDFGAIGDNNPANAAVNTLAIQKAIAAASSFAAPGVVYIPPSRGFVVNNGQITLTAPNSVIRGDASMGANSSAAPVSMLVGKGPGHTLNVTASGCLVSGLNFGPASASEQSGSDAFVRVTKNTCSFRDLCFYAPNIGLSVDAKPGEGGEFWIRDVLVQGKIKFAGISVSAGGGTCHISHTIMFSDNPPPPYGVLVTEAGELNLNDGCDIINCGTCLAIVPGLNGVKDQQAVAISVSQCLFDTPTGAGGVHIHPTNRGFVLKATFTDCWASTPTNPGNTNGFTLDGTDSQPQLFKSIQNVKFIGCVAKSFRNHCGWYCRGVDCLSVIGCTAGDCFNGMQFAPGCTNLIVTNNSCGPFVPASVPGVGAGNQAYGIYLELGLGKLICTGNMLTGNAFGGLFNAQPNPNQVVGQNVQ